MENTSSHINIQDSVNKINEHSYTIKTDTLVYYYPNPEQYTSIYTISILIGILAGIIFSIYWIKRQKQKITEVESSIESTTDLKNRQRSLHRTILESSAIYLKIQHILELNKERVTTHALLSLSDWDNLSKIIETLSPNFTHRLIYNFPDLKQEDLHFCYLVKIGLKYAEIGTLLGRTPNMMYKRKNIIIKRMGISNTKKSFEQLIIEF